MSWKLKWTKTATYACAKYRCQRSDDPTQTAYVRIYKQIYHFGTEADDSAPRARQAVDWIPPELRAYKEMTDKGSSKTPRLLGWRREKQDGSGLVPGGFLVSLAWEEVPGIQIGDKLGSDRFWAFERGERDRIRAAFKRTLEDDNMGFEPLFGQSHMALFMVGFREWNPSEPRPWTVRNFAFYGLVKIPEDCEWGGGRDWDGDTSSWEF